MKFIIIDTYYPKFLKNIYHKHTNLHNKKYSQQLKFLLGQNFGTSNFYSQNLKKLGHQTQDIIANNRPLQFQWAKENHLEMKEPRFFSWLQTLPLLHRFLGRPKWVQRIVLEQIKQAKPDIVYVQDLSILNPNTLKEVKQHAKLLVGQIACPLPAKDNLRAFDLILTSFPHYVKRFRKMGINSEYFKIAFESKILKKIGNQKRQYDVTFIGSFTPSHQKGIRLLESVAKEIPVNIWGQGKQFLSPQSPLRQRWQGEAWGLDMYQKLAQSKMVINRHIGVAENYANNMRLYESTGMGAMLITDKKKNLNDLFKVGKEVVEYTNSKDLIKKIKYFLNHENERVKIALAGQKRTIKDHKYENRMNELVKIIKKYI